MKYLLTITLFLIMSAPAMAREAGWNFVGAVYSEANDYSMGTLFFSTELGGQYIGGMRVTRGLSGGDFKVASLEWGRHWDVTEKGAIYAKARAHRTSFDGGATWIYSPEIGFKTGLGEDFEGGFVAGYNFLDEQTYSSDYWHYTLWGEIYVGESELSIMTSIHYDEFSSDIRPGVGAFWHW